MNRSVTDLSDFRADVHDQTHLGRLCGSGQRFLDRYEILKILGRGGFGITFLARDIFLPGRPLCVIKQLCPKVNDAAALQQARKRFEQEAATLGKLGSHAQIPQLLNYFETGGDFYLVQEYVRGATLTKMVQRHGPFSESGVKQFLREFLPLLQYVHNSGVIHRDVKPPNVIRCRDDGRLVLIDFGAVKQHIIQGSDASAKPTTTQFVGTVGFAPPEQLASRPIYSSDIYAVGITCLYLLSGKPPLEFDYDFLTGDVRWSDHIVVSDHFGSVLSKMLRVSPQERFQSVDEVVRSLELEPYFDNLAHCMNIKPKPFTPTASTNKTPAESYVSPTARTAMAIRDWQAKLKARQVRDHLHQAQIIHSSSNSFR